MSILDIVQPLIMCRRCHGLACLAAAEFRRAIHGCRLSWLWWYHRFDPFARYVDALLDTVAGFPSPPNLANTCMRYGLHEISGTVLVETASRCAPFSPMFSLHDFLPLIFNVLKFCTTSMSWEPWANTEPVFMFLL